MCINYYKVFCKSRNCLTGFSGIEEDRQETELKSVQSQENTTNQPVFTQENVGMFIHILE